jgi:predicted secreted protein
MKLPKLLKKAQEYIDSDKGKRLKKIDSLKEILKKLNKKHQQTKIKLSQEKDEKRHKQLKKELCVLFEQRKKGLKALKRLKKS